MPSVEKVPIDQAGPQGVQETNANNSVSVSDPNQGHSVPSMEGVFCHSDTSAEENLPYHSVPSMEEGSQMNSASISEMVESQESQNSLNSGSNKPSFSIADLPLTQEKVESTYMQTSSKVLVNFQEILTS